MDSVLVTGASFGLGLEMSLHLAERGFDVYATVPDLSERGPLDETAAKRGVRVNVARLDVTDPQSIDAAVAAMVERSGGVYGVVNNAGIALRGYFEDLLEEEIRRVFEVNVFGSAAVTRAVLPHMRAAGRGRIVFITSIGGRVGAPAVSAYASSKFAQEGFGESLSQELRPFGIYVSLVEPGIIPTERFGAHRGFSHRALDPGSPYHAWFLESQRLTDRLVESSPTKPGHVARAVHQALTARRPKLRYVVGRRAALVLLLRRYLPGETFERIYFGEVMRRITRPSRKPAE